MAPTSEGGGGGGGDPTALCVGEINSMNARCNPIKNRADCEKEGKSFFSKDGVCNWEGGDDRPMETYAPTVLPTRSPTPVPGSQTVTNSTVVSDGGDGHVECPGFSFGSNAHCDCEGDCEEYADSWCGCAAARASSCCNTPAGDDESS